MVPASAKQHTAVRHTPTRAAVRPKRSGAACRNPNWIAAIVSCVMTDAEERLIQFLAGRWQVDGTGCRSYTPHGPECHLSVRLKDRRSIPLHLLFLECSLTTQENQPRKWRFSAPGNAL